MGIRLADNERAHQRVRHFHFDPARKLMSTVDRRDGRLWVDTKGAPEAVLPRCTTATTPDGGTAAPLDEQRRREVEQQVDSYARAGLRVLAFAVRPVASEADIPAERDDAERDLSLAGLAALLDPPRPEVAGAVAHCHSAGIRVIVVTGDHPLTAAAVARAAGIGGEDTPVVTGEQLDKMSEQQTRNETLRRQSSHYILASHRSTPFQPS